MNRYDSDEMIEFAQYVISNYQTNTLPALLDDWCLKTGKHFKTRGELIAEKVCEFKRVNIKAVKGRTRLRPIVDARHTVLAILKELCPEISSTERGKIIQRDHATAIMAERKMIGICQTNKAFRLEYQKTLQFIKEFLEQNDL